MPEYDVRRTEITVRLKDLNVAQDVAKGKTLEELLSSEIKKNDKVTLEQIASLPMLIKRLHLEHPNPMGTLNHLLRHLRPNASSTSF